MGFESVDLETLISKAAPNLFYFPLQEIPSLTTIGGGRAQISFYFKPKSDITTASNSYIKIIPSTDFGT